MRRFMVGVVMLLLLALTACSRDQRDSGTDLSETPQSTRMNSFKDKRGERAVVQAATAAAIRSQVAEDVMRVSVATARTIRVARQLVDEMVDRIIGLDDGDERLSKMKALSRIVAQRPIDTNTSPNRSFSHEVRFVMGLEVFDGFVRLGDMDAAWGALLFLLRNYRAAVAEANAELKEIQKTSIGSAKGETRTALRNAQWYYRSVNNGYEAAREFLCKFVLPHLSEKHPIPDEVAGEMSQNLK